MEKELLQLKTSVQNGADLQDLLDTKFPLIIPDYQSAKDFLYSNMDDMAKTQAIIDAYSVKKYLEENRLHEKKSEQNSYNIYLDIRNHDTDPLNKRMFQIIFNAISSITLNKKCLSFSPKSTEAFEILTSLGLSNFEILRFIKDVRSGNSIQYLKESLNTEANDQHFNVSLKKAITYINREPRILIDALCKVSFDEDHSDDVLECRFILNKIVDLCTKTNPQHIYFLNPEPYFIRTVLDRAFFNQYHLSFSTENNEYSEILRRHYLNSNASFTNLENLISHICEEGKYPDLTIMFGNRSKEIYDKTIEALSILIDSAPDVHSLLVFDSDAHIQTSTSDIHKILNETDIQSIDLIPDSIPDITFPRRKILVQCRYGFFDNRSSHIDLRHYTHDKQTDFPAISCKSFTTKLSYEEFNNDCVSLRGKFRKDKMLHDTKTAARLNQPHPYYFSPEICFYVNVSGGGTAASPYRVSAYARALKKSKAKPKKIHLSSASTKLASASEIDEWITRIYPFIKTKEALETSTVRDAISREFRNSFTEKPISLKSFLYLYEEFEKEQPIDAVSEIRFWMDSALGEYRIDMITLSDLEEFLINSYIVNQRNISYHQALELFRRLFNFAIKNNHCKANPASELLKKNTIANEDIYDINAALKRKMLYPSEIKLIVNQYFKLGNTNRSLAIALLIQLLLGLDPNIICALLWSDFNSHTINGKILNTLHIRRQLNTEGTKYIPFKRREFYRTIPIPKLIAEMILTEKQYQLEHIANGNDKYLQDCSIVVGSDHILNGQAMIMAPKTLYKECNKILKAFKDSDITLTVPTDNGGTTETNLSYYGSDIFRSNLRHYNCFKGTEENRILTKGEYCYLAGLKGPDTFSRNYCDYGNLKSLEKLYKKIERLIRRMMK